MDYFKRGIHCFEILYRPLPRVYNHPFRLFERIPNCDPASTSHRTVAADIRKRQGITDGLMRLSVGIEDAEDLIRDLAQALEKDR